ncbi:MAG: DUF4976 domain-containing protein, partial [Bacteroidales bacterium]|nr:DUF4976 domain-containing protein [Bacteroidales bacterium]
LDIYPTITDICGVFLTEHQDGVNLSNAIKGGKSNVNRNLYWHFPVYTPAYHPDKDMGSDRYFRTRPGSAIISNNYKLIEYFEDNTVELYHLTSDPGESNNIADMHHEIVSKLLKDLRDWRDIHKAYVPRNINPSYNTLISIK